MGYDSWKQDAPEQDEEPAPLCPVCTGDNDAEACSEACQHIADVMQANSSIAHIYEYCRRALGLARQYRDEERVRGRKSRRLEAVMQQVAVWREDIRLIRASQRKKEAA